MKFYRERLADAGIGFALVRTWDAGWLFCIQIGQHMFGVEW